jgi:hypothetical protein
MPQSATPRPVRRRALSVLLALFGLLVLVTPTVAAPPHLQTWHRLNPASEDVAAEHERLQCLPGVQWVCRYDKLAGPDLHWDRTIGMFHGRDFPFTQADCPDWFPTEICEAAEQVIVGWITYVVDEGGAFKTGHALIFTDGVDVAPLYVYWLDDGFVCPWYGSFEDAMAANPTGAEQDCIFAPPEE